MAVLAPWLWRRRVLLVLVLAWPAREPLVWFCVKKGMVINVFSINLAIFSSAAWGNYTMPCSNLAQARALWETECPKSPSSWKKLHRKKSAWSPYLSRAARHTCRPISWNVARNCEGSRTLGHLKHEKKKKLIGGSRKASTSLIQRPMFLLFWPPNPYPFLG